MTLFFSFFNGRTLYLHCRLNADQLSMCQHRYLLLLYLDRLLTYEVCVRVCVCVCVCVCVMLNVHPCICMNLDDMYVLVFSPKKVIIVT